MWTVRAHPPPDLRALRALVQVGDFLLANMVSNSFLLLLVRHLLLVAMHLLLVASCYY